MKVIAGFAIAVVGGIMVKESYVNPGGRLNLENSTLIFGMMERGSFLLGLVLLLAGVLVTVLR